MGILIRIAIVEDEVKVQKQLGGYIKKYEEEREECFEVFFFKDGDEIVEDYRGVYDIIFLDIQMKRMDGMSAAEKIREMDTEVIIIFITNMANYAIRGYAVDAMDFVLKPIHYFAFSEELKKALSRLALRKKNYLLIPVENGVVRLEAANVLYIESISRRLIVHGKKEEYTIKGTLKELEEKLKEQYFFRCNNCYLVNLAYVEEVTQNIVQVGDHQLQISRPRKKAFMNALADYVGGVIK
ncbi:LytTR family DNA-binding domain-containing protein [Ohessyouella blattaphilus]|uniref:LytR/AlgR family response regulator transcription factor n=1 Tax=Ohessyouella blattaphilus TaxID=2949333 RepID=UPI002916ABFF|nr:LytTR family DNA-binding domain-containing protein [Ohessyouella blattaphilus]